MSKIPTDTYVWGNGYQKDQSNDYSNFWPKKLKNFIQDQSNPLAPHIIDMAFGWFHEAYISKDGDLYICHKHRLSSKEIDGKDDKYRENMTHLELKGEKVF